MAEADGNSAALTLSEASLIRGRAVDRAPAGEPIPEPPPLVEPIGFADPFEGRAITGSHRPERRRFLAPNPRVAAAGDRVPLSDVRPRLVEHAPLRTAAVASLEAEQPAIVPIPGQTTAPAPVTAKTNRPRLVFGLKAALLVMVTLAGAGMLLWPGWVAPLHKNLTRYMPGPAAPRATGPQTGPADRFAANLDAAKAGNVEAQLAVAIQYAKADGTARDYTAAAKWFSAAAQSGNIRAQYDVGVLYERGRGVPLDYAQAVSWYRKAAERKHPMAQYNLAVAYTKGEGVERNFFEAAVWYNRAALQGVIAAMVNLAILYERGDGVEKSPAIAYAWYRAAARRGSTPAARRADELLAAFSPDAQTEAEAKTREIALQIQDALGESDRAAAQNKTSASSQGVSPELKSGFDKENGPARSEDAPDVTP